LSRTRFPHEFREPAETDSGGARFRPGAGRAGQPQRALTHTAHFGVPLQQKLRAPDVESEPAYPGAPEVKRRRLQGRLIEKLKAPGP
jgi:hypothetical protein